MKKILFTIIATICSIGAFCQVTQEHVGSVEFPELTSIITKEQLREHIEKKFNNDQVLLKDFSHRKPEHAYIIKDVLIDINFANIGPNQKVDINQKKKDFDFIFHAKSYKSEIREINENKALIINRLTSGTIEMYQFFLYNKDGTKVIVGMLDFQQDNKEAAKKILEHILQHAKFKD